MRVAHTQAKLELWGYNASKGLSKRYNLSRHQGGKHVIVGLHNELSYSNLGHINLTLHVKLKSSRLNELAHETIESSHELCDLD